LVGPAGSGKSESVIHLSRKLQALLFQIGLNPQSNKYELLGQRDIVAQDGVPITQWTDACFVMAVRAAWAEYKLAASEGRKARWVIFLMDEYNLSKAGATGFLNSFCDGARQITLETGECIERPPNFRIIITMNDGYSGTSTPNEAFAKSRMRVIEFDYPDPRTEENILMALYENLPKVIATTITTMGNVVRKSRDKGDIPFDFCLRTAGQIVECWADKLNVHGAPDVFPTLLGAFEEVVLPKIGNKTTWGSQRSAILQAAKTAGSSTFR
jgi:MoxR-like ATPase